MASLQILITRFEVFATWVGDTFQLRGFKVGGTAGQVPVKSSGTNFAWAWGTVTTPSDSLKANLASPTFTGTVTLPSTTSIGTISSAEFGYLDGVTSAIQSQIDLKSPLTNPTFTGTPLAPTAAPGTNTTQISTTAFVTSAVSASTVTLTGAVTSVGNATSLGSFTVAQLSGAISDANIAGDNTGDNAVNSLYSGLVSNATHTGDATGSTALTLATVNANVGSFGSGAAIPVITTNAKGLVTGVVTAAITAPASGLTGTALPVGITSSSGLTTVAGGTFGTLAFQSGTFSGTATGTNTGDNATNTSAARAIETKTATFTAVLGGRYMVEAPGLISITDPTGTVAGQSYEVWIGGGNVQFNGAGTTFGVSRASIRRRFTGFTWTTPDTLITASGQFFTAITGAAADGVGVAATASGTGTALTANATTGNHVNIGVGKLIVANSGNTTLTGTLTASSLSGVGTGLTALNATNLTSGTVAIARLVSTQTVGNADATIASGTRDVILGAALTAPRSYAWPAANTYPAGARVSFTDMEGTLTAVNTATLARSGGNTINGLTSMVLSTAGASPILISDGVSKWNVDIRGISRGGTGAITAAGARTNLGAAASGANTDITSITSTGALTFTTTGATALTLATNGVNRWNVSSTGHLLANADNTYDIGASGANRPRNIFASTLVRSDDIRADTQFTVNNKFVKKFPSDGVVTFMNWAQSDFNRFQFGGTTSSFPALKRNGTAINIRLADDSADAPLTASNITASGTLAVTGKTIATGGVQFGTSTVATLPAAAANTYLELVVTDALAPAVGATVAAGGSAKCKVMSNGTAYIVTANL